MIGCPVPSEELQINCPTDIERAYDKISLIRHVVLLGISPPILSACQKKIPKNRILRFFTQNALRHGSYDVRINSS